MKNVNSANLISRIFILVAVLGFVGAFQETGFAKLSKTRDFASVDGDDIDSEDVEEVVVVREAPRKKRRVIREEQEVQVVPASQVNVTTNASADSAAASSAQQETAGDRIGKLINSKLEAKQRAREEEMRRKQKEDEDKLVSRIGSALDDQPASYESQQIQGQAQAQQQQVVVQDARAYRTTDADYASDIDGTTSAKAASSSGDKGVTVMPQIGIAGIRSDQYDISDATSLGLAADFSVDDNIAVNIGYTYAEYEIGLLQNGNYYNGFNNYYYNMYKYNAYLNNNQNKLEYNQNTIEAGVKYLLFDRSSKIRPYFGAGGAYSMGYLNYTQRQLNTFQGNPFANNNGQLNDYEISSWAAVLQLGTLVNFSDTFGLGVHYKYYKLLSSSEDQKINNYAFINNGYGYAVAPTDKDFVRGTLADSDFHMLNFSLNLSF